MSFHEYGDDFEPMKTTTVSEAAELAWHKLTARRDGLEKYVESKFKKMSKAVKLDYNRIYTISAASGGGKSVLAKDIVDSIADEDAYIYMFNGEMLGADNFLRSVSTHTGLSLSTLESEDEPLSDRDFEQVKDAFSELSSRDNIFMIDEIATPDRVVKTMRWLYEFKCRPDGKKMICVLDHILLTASSREFRNDIEKIEHISLELIKLKKDVYEDRGKAMFLILSQENRNSKQEARIKNENMHFPVTSDIFGSSTLEMASDAMIAIKIPDKFKIEEYGPGKFPVVVNVNKVEVPMAYMHIIKNRAGKNDIVIPLVNNLEFFSFSEMDKETFDWILNEYQEKGVVNIEYD